MGLPWNTQWLIFIIEHVVHIMICMKFNQTLFSRVGKVDSTVLNLLGVKISFVDISSSLISR